MSDSIRAFTMPKWGLEMQEGTVQEWLAAEGDEVAKGQAIALVETDKIVNEVEADCAGVLCRLLATPGETYAVGSLLAVIADPGVDNARIDDFLAAQRGSKTSAPARAATGAPAGREGAGADRDASPSARQLAETLAVDLATVDGTGRKGRITLQDVEQAAKARGLLTDDAASDSEAYSSTTLTGRRRTAAKRLAQAKREIPHFYLRRTLSMDPLLAHRRERREAGEAATINDYLIKACASALMAVPEVNAQLHGDELRQYHRANVAIAIQLASGLITPVVHGSDELSIGAIADEVRRLAAAADTNRLTEADMQGATLTLSNLGMHGIETFDAIINPPAVTILAVGRVAEVPVVVDGEVTVASRMQVCLSCDHRAVDGVLGARFLAALAEAVENPASNQGDIFRANKQA